MDENRKDELEAQEESVKAEEQAADLPEVQETQEAPAAQEQTSELEKELEDIRDMFQQELDNATNETPLIQELEDISEADGEADAEEETEPRLCECCGENECSDKYGEDYPYCDDCRELMKKYPMRWSGILMTIVMIAVFIASAFASVSYAEDFVTVADAALNYGSGKVMTGMTAYHSYISSASDDKISMKAVKDILEGFGKTGYITDAASLIRKSMV